MAKEQVGVDNTTGKPIFGEEVEVLESSETWNTYKVADGSLIKVKLVAMKVLRTEAYRPDGNPIYVFHSQNVMTVTSPDELRKTVDKA